MGKLNSSIKRWVFTSLVGLVATVTISMLVYPQYRVYLLRLEGEAILAKSEAQKRVLVEQARAEKEAAQLRAEAINILGEAAQKFPEYREQEFMGAFAEALREGNMQQIIYVPTEANIPIIERKR